MITNTWGIKSSFSRSKANTIGNQLYHLDKAHHVNIAWPNLFKVGQIRILI